MAAMAYWILQRVIIHAQGRDSVLERAIGRDWKGSVSPLLYIGAVVIAPFAPSVAGAIYVLVAVIWLVPDRRIERVLRE
jgi:uncharacterized membrane protein